MNQLHIHQTKISSNMQTYIPRPIQQRLNLKGHQSLSWIIQNNQIIIKKSDNDQDIIMNTKGLARKLYQSQGGGKKWLQKERKNWK